MAPRADQDSLSSTDDDESDDEGLKEDLAALSRAFDMSGADSTAPPDPVLQVDFDDDLRGGVSTAPPAAAFTDLVVRTNSDDELRNDPLLATGDAVVSIDAVDSGGYESNEDIEYLQRLQNLYKPLATLPPPSPSPPPVDVFDDDDDDVETVRAIFKRFADYDMRGLGTMTEGDQATSPGPERDIANGSTSSVIVEGGETCPVYHDRTNSTDFMTGNTEMQHSGLAESSNPDASTVSRLPRRRSSFPPLAQALFDALKKNRSLQKFIRSKMIEIEAKIEENKQLRNNVKILKDFQASCIRRTGSALSLKKDPRVLLISAQKVGFKRKSPMCFGPPDNRHVANYKMVLERFPRSLDRKKWSNEEKENLMKGIKQQFQESLVIAMSSEVPHGDGNYMDSIMEYTNQVDITPEIMKKYLPDVNWDKLASTHVPGRTGAECESRWLNCEDPLINHGPWTSEEDRLLLLLVQQMGIRNWFDISKSLGTNRTPFQCLARFQRSLNPSMLNREWTKEEDAQLCSAVAIYGESNWQAVASVLERRTGTQCSNRWKKSLFPERKGSYTQEEDKRLTVAVMLFGRKWNQIARFVPGRTQCQCRDRYVNSLNPSLKWGGWTDEEDSRLQAAIAKHGFCWSKVAEDMPPRTDSQCRKRFKVLFPDQAYLLQEARKKQKSLIAGNFVDRESERPNLTLNDFLPLPTLSPLPCDADDENLPRKRKRKSSNEHKKFRSRRPAKKTRTNHNDGKDIDESKIFNGDVNIPKRTRSKKNSRNTLVHAKEAENTKQNAEIQACSGKLSRIKGAETSKNKLKNKMLKPESLSTVVECSGSQNEDNTTLSSFLHMKLNKRGLKCNKNKGGAASAFATNVVSKQVDNQSSSAEQDGLSQLCGAGGVEHLVTVQNNSASDRLLRKPENVNRLTGGEDDNEDITLDCLVGNKSKECSQVTKGPSVLSSSKSKHASVSLPEVHCTEKAAITADCTGQSTPNLVEDRSVSPSSLAEPTTAFNAEEEDELLATFMRNKSKGARRKVKRKEGNC
ncbi:hypothetical protein HN51_008833 [Arachis hypogaea]